jgi:hypothetical protein
MLRLESTFGMPIYLIIGALIFNILSAFVTAFAYYKTFQAERLSATVFAVAALDDIPKALRKHFDGRRVLQKNWVKDANVYFRKLEPQTRVLTISLLGFDYRFLNVVVNRIGWRWKTFCNTSTVLRKVYWRLMSCSIQCWLSISLITIEFLMIGISLFVCLCGGEFLGLIFTSLDTNLIQNCLQTLSGSLGRAQNCEST